jgi:hypothetical protein
MTTTTLPSDDTRSPRARGLGAPRGGRARSAGGRRSSPCPTSPVPAAPATGLSRYSRKVTNHPVVTCDDPAGWRRGARMNLRALAAAGSKTAPPTTSVWRPAATCGCARSAQLRSITTAELQEALGSWTQQGHSASLVTITVPHDLDDPLSRLSDAQKDAWNHARATPGLAAVRWSRGLRVLLLCPNSVAEGSAEELASEHVNGALVIALDIVTWWRLRAAGLDLAALIAAETGSDTALSALLLPGST